MSKRILAVQESDLRMDGDLAMTIQRVLPVTQAEINTAAANGEYLMVEKCIEVGEPIDNTKGGVMRVIKVNSITPGQNIIRVLIENSTTPTVVGPAYSPLSLPNAVANSLEYVKAYGLCEQFVTPAPDVPTGILCNNGGLKVDGNGDIYADGNTETLKDSQNNTATCEMLLSLASYHDEQNIITGDITRKIGIKVLDGTEDWQPVSTWFEANILNNGLFTGILCTHFPMGVPTNPDTIHSMTGKLQINYSGASTAAELKTWLAGQYANGTPVIVVYVLGTPTTESVAGQTMDVNAGNNTITITDGSLSDLQIEAKYIKTV